MASSTKWLHAGHKSPNEQVMARELLVDLAGKVGSGKTVLLHQDISAEGALVSVFIPGPESVDAEETAMEMLGRIDIPGLPSELKTQTTPAPTGDGTDDNGGASGAGGAGGGLDDSGDDTGE